MITDKKNNKKVLEEANDVTPEDLVTLEGDGTETNVFLFSVRCSVRLNITLPSEYISTLHTSSQGCKVPLMRWL